MISTVFLDRDGVINVDSKNYIKHPGEFNFITGSARAISLLSQAGITIIVITNQSVIARKMASEKNLTAVFNKMKAGVAKAGGRIDDIFFCPHHPRDNCKCRKPSPKMILDAVKKHDINLLHSVMVGDSAKDIECGIRAGCAKTILVQTGNGKKAKDELSRKGLKSDVVCADLHQAACWILKKK